jgi:hypothetical protein
MINNYPCNSCGRFDKCERSIEAAEKIYGEIKEIKRIPGNAVYILTPLCPSHHAISRLRLLRNLDGKNFKIEEGNGDRNGLVFKLSDYCSLESIHSGEDI